MSFAAARAISISSVSNETVLTSLWWAPTCWKRTTRGNCGGNDTTVTGVKSFKTITSITANAAVTGKVEIGPSGPLNTTTSSENLIVAMDSTVKTIQVSDNDSAKEVAAKINSVYAGGGVDGSVPMPRARPEH